MMRGLHLSRAIVEREGVRVVDGVDLSVEPGMWFGLIGANGSGKTSVLRAIAGRLPLAAGSCVIDGVDLAHDRAARARQFGFAPPADMLPNALRAHDVLRLVGGDIDSVRERLGPIDNALGIGSLLDRWIGDCSAGMRQRIAIAVAFAVGHRAVILDEPFNWLDPVAIHDLRAALRSMVTDGLILLTALHDLTALAMVCDTGLMLAEGRAVLTLGREQLRTAAVDPLAFERDAIDLLRASAGQSTRRSI